jgi:5'-3' exonuclease
VNEICNTEELVLEEMTVRADPSTKEELPQEVDSIPVNETLRNEYYKVKFDGIPISEIVSEYIKGLCWILRYYTHGCPSWGWFYPFLFPPCMSDFPQFSESALKEPVLGEPFQPLVQLMAVLPPQSAHALPLKMQELVLNSNSPLHSFFPLRFNVDLCGQRKTWKGVVLIPFIDAKLLVETLDNTDLELTPEEVERNQIGRTRIWTNGDGFGPQFWGEIEAIGETECFFNYPIVEREQNLAFVLLGAKSPPNAIGKQQKQFPLQIPGYPRGEKPEYRQEITRPKRTGKTSFLF